MISVLPARSAEDFETLAVLCRRLAQWDVDASAPYGVSEEDVRALFHPETSADLLATQFGAPDAMAFIARSEGLPAGCLAFDQFDDDTAELHRFFVDAAFRGQGIGRALMGAVLAEIEKGQARTVLIHTTFYMSNAIAVYEAFGFRPCAPFRETPAHVRHTDVFLSRSSQRARDGS
ncbi:GNAT family N-acetyltransferase [Mesorhizobium sp. VK23B]|uniref:GNAT family N-acetyltransferase n=1 Tax=Mesorhizobium dulcispinae TaxID=3072316 RepID=A0ABU4XQI8_9HYPH|nr:MULTISPECIES: GNAT family N-acetyltransferase [unclassified Mesorhizobium]MDX8470200.1 GNAT family N-acetyltransferase [Mesorhizobium sp. VK23B]MDX8476586.1 GNAT family N-acetyltransferase [Mesorhizobium sp. VK23A]